jgi:hypothetical protein
MARLRKKRHGRGIALPWEERAGWFKGTLTSSRWKMAGAILLIVAGVWLIWRAADTQARLRATHMAIADVHRAMSNFRHDLGRCPRDLDELLRPPRSGTRYLHDIPLDGWGRALYVRCPGRFDPDSADIVSAGPSGDFFDDDNVR